MAWKPSEKDGGSPIKHYIVEKREKFKRSWMQVTQIKSSETLSCVLTDLTEGKEYEVHVIAVNDVGSSKPLESDRPLVPKSPYSEYQTVLGLLQRSLYNAMVGSMVYAYCHLKFRIPSRKHAYIIITPLNPTFI